MGFPGNDDYAVYFAGGQKRDEAQKEWKKGFNSKFKLELRVLRGHWFREKREPKPKPISEKQSDNTSDWFLNGVLGEDEAKETEGNNRP